MHRVVARGKTRRAEDKSANLFFWGVHYLEGIRPYIRHCIFIDYLGVFSFGLIVEVVISPRTLISGSLSMLPTFQDYTDTTK